MLYIVCTVATLILSPYAIAVIAGIANGTFMKFRNIRAHVNSSDTCRYELKRSGTSVAMNTVGYFVSAIMLLFAVAALYLEKEVNVKLYIIAAASICMFCGFLYNVLHIFCDISIFNDKIYLYAVSTRFRVKVISISDVKNFAVCGTLLHSWVSISTEIYTHQFHGLENAYELMSAINKMQGVRDV